MRPLLDRAASLRNQSRRCQNGEEASKRAVFGTSEVPRGKSGSLPPLVLSVGTNEYGVRTDVHEIPAIREVLKKRAEGVKDLDLTHYVLAAAGSELQVPTVLEMTGSGGQTTHFSGTVLEDFPNQDHAATHRAPVVPAMISSKQAEAASRLQQHNNRSNSSPPLSQEDQGRWENQQRKRKERDPDLEATMSHVSPSQSHHCATTLSDSADLPSIQLAESLVTRAHDLAQDFDSLQADWSELDNLVPLIRWATDLGRKSAMLQAAIQQLRMNQ